MNGPPYNYPVETVRYGVSFGTALAIAIPYVNNQSILWAIIHGFQLVLRPLAAARRTAYSTPTSSVPSGSI